MNLFTKRPPALADKSQRLAATAAVLLSLLAGTAQSSAAQFSDNFEAAALNSFWEPYQTAGLVSISTDRTHTGSRSLALSSSSLNVQKNIGVIHNFGQHVHGTFSVWVWDSGADLLSANYVGVWARNRATQESLGIFTQDYDLGPSNGGIYYYSAPLAASASAVDRTQAWHRFTVTALADSVSLSVDSRVIYTAPVGFSFDAIEFEIHAPGFRPPFTYWFDDFNVDYSPIAPPVNHTPIVSAGENQTVCDDIDTVSLLGSATDPDGDALTYHWTQVAGPAVTLNGANNASASFTPPFVSPAQGSVTLTFQLEATDSNATPLSASSTVDVLVKHANRAPIAGAGADITVPEAAFVTLDGSGSFDPDNDAIASYAWTQTSGPAVTLNDAATATPTFTAPEVDVAGAELIFELIVTDAPSDEFCGAALTSAPQSVRVHVQYANRPPTIVAPSPLEANEGATVTLQTSATDPDGNSLTFTWTQLSGPAVTLDLLDPANPTFVAPQTSCAGDVLVFKVLVSDAYDGNAQAEITVTVQNINNPPVADAGANQSVPENADVSLDASASSDADGGSLSYDWIQVAGPAVTLSDSSIANPTFSTPIVTAGGDPGASELLVFEVTITDACGATATDLVEIKVSNTDHSPIANAGGSQTVSEGAPVTLDGSQSSDPDGDALTYSWVQTAGPAVVLSDANSAIAQFTAPLIGLGGATLVFELTVSDGLGGVSSDTATVAVLNINTPPDCGAAKATIATLWPPNHAMIPVNIVGVQDPDNNATVTITGVTQDEPTNGLGDGDTGPDAIIRDSSVLLRAERSGQANGRVYHIHFTAADHEGTCSGVVTVSVPHTKATAAAIDGGELFDSTK